MLERIKTIPVRAINRVGVLSRRNARPIMTGLYRSLRVETKRGLTTLAKRSADLYPVHEIHLAIDNLTNIEAAAKKCCRAHDIISAESALKFLSEQSEQTKKLLESVISTSVDAGEIVLRTLNLLFAAKQRVKQEFGIITALDIDVMPKSQELCKVVSPEALGLPPMPSVTEMVLPAAMLFQLRQMLFPAERMIVGAASKTGRNVSIKALFDVTGKANTSGVTADPDLLGQALIAMSETRTYFGIWVHSHPGMGSGATHPSGIDLNQESDWLKHYSADLVSAIMVKDKYVRFWGKAVESGRIAVRIEGQGVELVSETENVYRLGS